MQLDDFASDRKAHMSTLPPDVQERLLAFGTLPGKFIPPARRLGEGWNPSSLHNAANGDRVPQGVSAYHRAPNIIPSPSTTTIPFEAFPRVVIPTSAVPFCRGNRATRERVLRLDPAARVEHGREKRPTSAGR